MPSQSLRRIDRVSPRSLNSDLQRVTRAADPHGAALKTKKRVGGEASAPAAKKRSVATSVVQGVARGGGPLFVYMCRRGAQADSMRVPQVDVSVDVASGARP